MVGPSKDKLRLCWAVPLVVSLWFNSFQATQMDGQVLNQVHILVLGSWGWEETSFILHLPLSRHQGKEVSRSVAGPWLCKISF